MNIATIDCGTSNTRIFVVNEDANVHYRASVNVGVRDTAISGSSQTLKVGLSTLFERALRETQLQISDIHCILASGMISSEIGLAEIPHLWAPCTIDELASSLQPYTDAAVFPASVPVYFIRGIKNAYDAHAIRLQDIGLLDFMRGEETQMVGLMEDSRVKLPACAIVLSSHTKFIPMDAHGTILGSVTTLSGQLYQAILKETILGKSLQSDQVQDAHYFDAEIVENARKEIENSGFLRSLLLVRFQDTLLHAPLRERRLMAESLLAAEDMRALPSVEKIVGTACRNFILIGQPGRCRVYAHLLRRLMGKTACTVTAITDPAEIDALSIRGALTLAKRAGIL